MSEEDDSKSLEDVLRQGKKIISNVDGERESKLRFEQDRLKKEREEEKNSLVRVNQSRENFRVISQTSVVPFYSVINRELLKNRGIIFDWTRQDENKEIHWHTESYTPRGFDWNVNEYRAHILIYLYSKITLPNKSSVITCLPIEEQRGPTYNTYSNPILQDKNGPYRTEETKTFLGRSSYRKVYLDPDLADALALEERKMYVGIESSRNIGIPNFSPCEYTGGVPISLAGAKEGIYVRWSQAVVKQIEEIY
jgi:hypothetical protein